MRGARTVRQILVTYSGTEEKGLLISFLEGIGFDNVQGMTKDVRQENTVPAICVDIRDWTFFGVSATSAACMKQDKRDIWTTPEFLASCA